MFYASSFSPCVIAFFRAALRRDERRRRDDRHRRVCDIVCEPERPAAKDVSGGEQAAVFFSKGNER